MDQMDYGAVLPPSLMVFLQMLTVRLVSLPPPLERARCRDIGLPPTWSITTRETDSTHISQLKTPHLDKLIESKWARGQGAARGWTESWQGAERKELR